MQCCCADAGPSQGKGVLSSGGPVRSGTSRRGAHGMTRGGGLNELQPLQAGMPVLADDDVVVDGDAEGLGRLDDLLGQRNMEDFNYLKSLSFLSLRLLSWGFSWESMLRGVRPPQGSYSASPEPSALPQLP